MVGVGASMAITSIASWFTPTVLFCVLNLMIAIIFIASNYKSPHHHHQDLQSQLVRSPSLLERVKSVNFSSFYSTTLLDSHEIMTEYNSVTQLTRPPSFLQRVKSIDLSFSSFYTPPPVDQLQPPDSDQTRHDSLSQLTRVPSLLERVRSFKLPSPFSNSDHLSGDTSDVDRNPHRETTQDDDVAGEESETASENVTPATEKASPAIMTKSRSERRMPESDDDGESDEDVDRRRPATMRASIGGKDECVDAKADDFIKRFKQQLKLQRLDSLQRFREMLNRGTSA